MAPALSVIPGKAVDATMTTSSTIRGVTQQMMVMSF